MFNGKRLLIGVLCGLCLLSWGAVPAQASDAGKCSVRQAQLDVRAARRAYVRAASRYREAQRILEATRRYSVLYRPAVGRWVRLARRTGWRWGEMDWLMRQMEQESKGDPDCNDDGLLQIIREWWVGGSPAKANFWASHQLAYPWSPRIPAETFRHAHVMDKSNWWLVQ